MRLCGQVIDRLLPGESKVYENDLDALVDGSVPTVCTVQYIKENAINFENYAWPVSHTKLFT